MGFILFIGGIIFMYYMVRNGLRAAKVNDMKLAVRYFSYAIGTFLVFGLLSWIATWGKKAKSPATTTITVNN